MAEVVVRRGLFEKILSAVAGEFRSITKVEAER
jgi:hypothetical protein